MQYLEAPDDAKARWPYSFFLAGGITDCPNWQRYATKFFDGLPVTIFNPRRACWSSAIDAVQQIAWEHQRLREARVILFWFPAESLCPIALYELGAWAMTDKPLLVGTDPRYLRRHDIQIQLALARPDVTITDNLTDLIREARNYAAFPSRP